MSQSKIEWTEQTWNPMVGCKKVSPGCANCYAVKMAQRLKAMGQEKYKYAVDENGWTGFDFYAQEEPPNFGKKPKVIFVCSMSDIYYQGVHDWMIQNVYGYMGRNPRHTFIVCTKRPERIVDVLYGTNYLGAGDSLANVWHLASVENQEWADKRIPELLRLNEWGDWKLGLSLEPLLGKINIKEFLTNSTLSAVGTSQVIIGAESGPKRRECKIEWVRDIVEQCEAACVPCFVKQIHIDGKVSKNPDGWLEDILAARELAWTKTKHSLAGRKDK